ncbi:MAG: hypothetical protein KAY09_00865 [Nitrospira sp.]|nr:hypothetical protein [Nitrospira sp.]
MIDDKMVAPAHDIEDRLLRPQQLEIIILRVIDRREERTERCREHLAELNRRITETVERIGRLFDAIESRMVDKDDSVMKERLAGLKALGEQAKACAERMQLELESSGNQAVSFDMIETFTQRASERMRLENGGYRWDHLRALAQRVAVADDDVHIMGSKSEPLRSLVAASSVKSAAFGVRSSVQKWCARQDLNL